MAVCVCFICVIITVKVFIPNFEYNAAISPMDDGEYTEAITVFEALDGYKDSTEKASLAYKKYIAEKLSQTNVGECITFGNYEQDNKKANGKEEIEWIVLSKEENRTLVISKYALDCKQYNTSYASITWETCSLRKWLNNGFINTAFTDDEKEIIATTTVVADKNPTYDRTNPGEATQDKVFLLSINEANEYFDSDEARKCKPTSYAVMRGAYASDVEGNCKWWLRSPGLNQARAAHVYFRVTSLSMAKISTTPLMPFALLCG